MPHLTMPHLPTRRDVLLGAAFALAGTATEKLWVPAMAADGEIPDGIGNPADELCGGGDADVCASRAPECLWNWRGVSICALKATTFNNDVQPKIMAKWTEQAIAAGRMARFKAKRNDQLAPDPSMPTYVTNVAPGQGGVWWKFTGHGDQSCGASSVPIGWYTQTYIKDGNDVSTHRESADRTIYINCAVQ